MGSCDWIWVGCTWGKCSTHCIIWPQPFFAPFYTLFPTWNLPLLLQVERSICLSWISWNVACLPFPYCTSPLPGTSIYLVASAVGNSSSLQTWELCCGPPRISSLEPTQYVLQELLPNGRKNLSPLGDDMEMKLFTSMESSIYKSSDHLGVGLPTQPL